MASFAASLATLALLSTSAVADFTFGSISGQQIAGNFQTPSVDILSGHFISGSDGSDYSQGDFCDAIGLKGDDEDGNPLDEAWTKVDLSLDSTPNYCDIPIPGLKTTVRISNSPTVGGGDCGLNANDGDQTGNIVGSLIDTEISPDAAIGSCYYDYNCKYCSNTGSQYASAIFTCLSGTQGGEYGSGIKDVNNDDRADDC